MYYQISNHLISPNLIESHQILPNLTKSHHMSSNLTESHWISPNVPNLNEFHHISPNLTESYKISSYLTESHQISPYLAESHRISPNLIKSHQISPYRTKTKCQFRTSCGTILRWDMWGPLKIKLLYFQLNHLSINSTIYAQNAVCDASKLKTSTGGGNAPGAMLLWTGMLMSHNIIQESCTYLLYSLSILQSNKFSIYI